MKKQLKQTSLSDDQAEAISRIEDWWSRDEEQTFALAGYAGTGKTTVIAALLKDWSSDVVIGAPTGKAAHRLREKGVKASTIHQLAYRLIETDECGNPVFEYEGITRGKALVVIDEASMVNQTIYDDLIAGGYRMLFVGDHGQLAPVGGDPGIMREPDFTLSQIHRQDDEGLLDFAHALREGDPCPDASGAVEKIWIAPDGSSEEKVDAALAGADTVLCWQNRTRHWLNEKIMRLRGLLDEEPVTTYVDALYQLIEGGVPFPVVCLRNNYKKQVFNGQVFRLHAERMRNGILAGTLIDDGGNERGGKFDARGFFLEDRSLQPSGETMLFDFGCCLTAHKSQGSEWPWICVWDDTFPGMQGRSRWHYTAATRSESNLSWLHR